jgi:hypothetical protein
VPAAADHQQVRVLRPVAQPRGGRALGHGALDDHVGRAGLLHGRVQDVGRGVAHVALTDHRYRHDPR